MVHCFGVLTLLLLSPNLQFPFARQLPLFSFDGKNHWMEVERVSGQVAVENATDVELIVVSSNIIDLINAEADVTQPITGVDNSLKVYNLAENKTFDSEFEPELFFLIHAYRGIGS